MTSRTDLDKLRELLRTGTNGLATHIFDVLAPALITDEPDVEQRNGGKVINDPIWKVFSLPNSVLPLVELPLLQRLRRVRQLGLVHLVYPGGHHSRFEHSLGAMCASGRMFDILAETGGMQTDTRRKWKSVLLCAAVIHDAGHTIFSHVGERVLQRALLKEFGAVEAILRQELPETNFIDRSQNPPDPAIQARRSKLPPAAELVSALFALSPAMEKIVPRLALTLEPAEAILMICGLILGRARDLRDGDKYFHWLKGIISGDLDCDKIDYVARDAYYAGIPTATDIDRLLSQLTAVSARAETTASPHIKYQFGRGNPNELQLFGIRPAGASTLEMFVMARAYLFERLYAHPKVRAAERFLQRLLVQRIQYGREEQGWGLEQTLSLLYDPAGDDYVLGELAHEDDLPKAGDRFKQVAVRLNNRKLPVRALAISASTMSEGLRASNPLATAEFMPWQAAEDELSQYSGAVEFEQQMCELSGLAFGQDAIVDWYLPNPIREDPDIWVSDPGDGTVVKQVGAYFNVEQLANAYRSTKQVAWVFADRSNAVRVAAAASVILQRQFDLVPNQDAFNRAKIAWSQLQPVFTQFRARDDPVLQTIITNIEARTTDARLAKPPAKLLARTLLQLEEGERVDVSVRLERQIAQAKLSRSFYDHLYVALQVLAILVRHSTAYYRNALFAEPIAHQNERRFHKHLYEFCKGDDRTQRTFDVRSGEEAGGGQTDLVFEWKAKDISYPPVVVELKSKQDDYSVQYQQHGGQPFQYAGTRFGRISLLYVQFASVASVRMPDTIQARANTHQESMQLVLCLGQQAFAQNPSAGGATSVSLSS